MEKLVADILGSELLLLAAAMLGTMVLKDIVTSVASGLMFVWNKDFNVGDTVILDGEDAKIISIGTRQTIFEVGDCWLYIYNDRIKYLKLGKKK